MTKNKTSSVTEEELTISTIINNAKKEFKRDKSSIITDYLKKHPKSVVTSTINKKRGASVKIYYLHNGVKKSNDYVPKNAEVVLKALKANDYTVKDIEELKK